MSPDRKFFVGVTETGSVEVYNLETQQFAIKMAHSNGPFRGILEAVFYDRKSLALVHKKGPDVGRAPNEPSIDVIPCFQAEECIQYTRLSVSCSRPDLGLNNPPTIAMGAGVIAGKGRLIFQRNIFRSIVLVSPEDFPREDGVPRAVSISDGHRPYNADILAPGPSENDSPRTAEAYRILEAYVEQPWRMQELENALIAAAEVFDEEQIGESEVDPTDEELVHSASDHDVDVAPIAPPGLEAHRILDEAYDENGEVMNAALVPEQSNHEDTLARAALDNYHNHPVALAACGIFVTTVMISVGLQLV
ncbi:hypothetical protein HYPSUDRAFT_208510 [Hypholoma sublateritium FD-334 SS-4]|uniref:Uncharacterized protein n=1 Tax=Hypholoma sublateritium (strain FD-334 SS-4) TaxID=945553 RepID=A0A0D2NDM6_HYPSF|nr:hypothetical protein HYPSUDRAFT_208510 [Hypholoma sublateritium FD-334 SS-4]